MKAIVGEKYGSPDVLHSLELPKPVPGDDELLIKVQAASVNPLDWHHLRGKPFLLRLSAGLLKPKNRVLGADIAGRVEAVGRNVSQFGPGDEVFGDISLSGLGAFAEYVCVGQHAPLALKPAAVTFEEAAAVPVAATTALLGLRDTGQVQPGQRVLINGASGGVGTFAVQLARTFGAEVTGVCSTRNVELVRSLGADHVIDYTKEDFTRNGRRYDLIIDNVGNRSPAALRQALERGGVCVIIGFTTPLRLIQAALLGAWTSMAGERKIRLLGVAGASKTDLAFLGTLLESGRIKAVIDRRYPLSGTAEAVGYVEEGHARGKVVISVATEAVPAHHPSGDLLLPGGSL